jgi:hypothetical protein
VDGTCCAVNGCPECQTCATADGTCQPLAAGLAPRGQCPGSKECGGGQCDGAGQCAYLAPGAVCGQQCLDKETNEVWQCDAAHECAPQPAESCAPYTCDRIAMACRTGCRGHEECVDASLCDRVQAHVTGAGVCVAPDQIVKATTTIQAAVNELGSRTHIKVVAKGSFFDENVTIVGKAVTLVGAGVDSTIIKPSLAGAGISLSGGADVKLQDLRIQGAGGPGADGVHCVGPGTAVTVIESIINGHLEQGIDAAGCYVTVRRSTFESNAGGGLRLLDGTAVLVDSIVRHNGTSASAFGGVSLSAPSLSGVTFANNTLYENAASAAAAGGVICSVAYTLHNSILWANGGAGQLQGCALNHSNVQGGAPFGGGNLSLDCSVDVNGRPAATSACVNAGDNAAPGIGALDFGKAPRVQGGTIDLGAYELQ